MHVIKYLKYWSSFNCLPLPIAIGTLVLASFLCALLRPLSPLRCGFVALAPQELHAGLQGALGRREFVWMLSWMRFNEKINCHFTNACSTQPCCCCYFSCFFYRNVYSCRNVQVFPIAPLLSLALAKAHGVLLALQKLHHRALAFMAVLPSASPYVSFGK